jgi:hypothetical protein
MAAPETPKLSEYTQMLADRLVVAKAEWQEKIKNATGNEKSLLESQLANLNKIRYREY